MKKFIYLLTLVGSLMFVSCHEEPSPAEVTLAINVDSITAASALVTVTPSDTNVLYYFDLLSQDVYEDEYEGNAIEVANDLINWIIESVEEYQDYGYDVEVVDWLSRGVDEYNFSGLSPETNYVVFAFRVDTATNTLAGNVFHAEFTTHPVEFVDLSFELANTDTAIWFVPNVDDTEYFATYVEVDTLQAYGITATEYFEDMISYYGEYIEYFTMSGPIYVYLEDLTVGTNYVFLAQAYTGGVWNSRLFAEYFEAPVESESPKVMSPKTKMLFNRNAHMKLAKRLTIENNKVQKL